MYFRETFCSNQQTASIRIGILLGSLIFVIVFFLSVFTYLRCYMYRRRVNYRKRCMEATIRQDKAEDDAWKLLTYVAYLRKMNLIKPPDKMLNPTTTRNLLYDNKWDAFRQQAYVEVMALYGKETKQTNIEPWHDRSQSSTSVGSTRGNELAWYDEKGNNFFWVSCEKTHKVCFSNRHVSVTSGQTIPENLDLLHAKSSDLNVQAVKPDYGSQIGNPEQSEKPPNESPNITKVRK